MPEPTRPAHLPESPKRAFVAVGVAAGHRHAGVVARIGNVLGPHGAVVVSRQPRESTEQFVERIIRQVHRFTRALGPGTRVAVAGLPLGAAGPRVRGDLARLREVHATVHERLPDAIPVTPTVGERGSHYPKALTRRPAPSWIRHANQHPRGSRRPLRAAWDATRALMAADSDRSPALPPHVSNLTDRVGSAPGVPAGQAVGGGAPAGAEPSPRGDVPTRPRGDTEPVIGGGGQDPGDTFSPAPIPPELRDRLGDLSRILNSRSRDYATARKPIADALHWTALEAIDQATRRAARQPLPRRLQVTQRHDPRVVPLTRINACTIEDRAYQRPWLLQRVCIGERTRQQYQLWGDRWRLISLQQLIDLPTLHGSKPRVVVVRGRYEPTRLTLALGVAATLALTVLTAAAAAVYAAELLTMLIALAVGLAVTAGRRRQRQWWQPRM